MVNTNFNRFLAAAKYWRVGNLQLKSPPMAQPARMKSARTAISRMTAEDALVFSCKAATAAAIALLTYSLFKMPGAIWAPISAVIVTQPKLHPSYKASLSRVAANMIGAFVGALASAAAGHTILAMAIGVLVTGLVCCFARMEDAIRPAFAAVVIVTLNTTNPHVWAGSLDRVMGVAFGCVAALAVAFAFDIVTSSFSRPKSHKPEE
jgi:uncharacterized membrane protein YgaE (UPF0421/DUF939 family)